jgi:hypothetical protein
MVRPLGPEVMDIPLPQRLKPGINAAGNALLKQCSTKATRLNT